jgi:hypothetical protein
MATVEEKAKFVCKIICGHSVCEERENWVSTRESVALSVIKASGSCNTEVLDELNNSQCRAPPSCFLKATGAHTLPRAAHYVLQKLGHGPERQLDLPGFRGLP